IDSDDYVTPFNWYQDPNNPANNQWVFGTEMPRLIVNEVYSEFANVSPARRGLGNITRGNATDETVDFWMELHNPMLAPPTVGRTPGTKASTSWGRSMIFPRATTRFRPLKQRCV